MPSYASYRHQPEWQSMGYFAQGDYPTHVLANMLTNGL